MLKHMIKAQVLNLVFGRVDLVVRILEVRLDDKSRRITSLRSTGMVGAGVATFGKNIRNVAILPLP